MTISLPGVPARAADGQAGAGCLDSAASSDRRHDRAEPGASVHRHIWNMSSIWHRRTWRDGGTGRPDSRRLPNTSADSSVRTGWILRATAARSSRRSKS